MPDLEFVTSLLPYVLQCCGLVILGFLAYSLGTYVTSSSKDQAAISKSIAAFLDYYRTLYYFLITKGALEDCPYFKDNTHAQCHIYSLALIFYIWDRPHYRHGTFKDDMLANLRNVAVPGTGIPLHLFAYLKITTYWMVLVGYPILSFFAAVNVANRNFVKFCTAFSVQLTEPQDWFSFWRLNCRLATAHASLTPWKVDYEMEDKWKFLTDGEKLQVNVTPYLKIPSVVCKHRNEEGGLGYSSFKNASVGGNWIIQEKLSNGPFLRSMLPPNAPLSTFRIITASRGGLIDLPKQERKHEDVVLDDIIALSCVWRAGRAKAITDHSAILFNVNPKTGEIKKGTTNVHWYQLGLSKILTTPWVSHHNETHHPDTGVPITGVTIPNMTEMMDFVRDAHLRMMPHVPLSGWDIAMTENHGMLLLEANLSCNFFRGDFDQTEYFKFIKEYFVALDCHRAV